MIRSPSPMPHGDSIADGARLTAHDGQLLATDGTAMIAWSPNLLRALHQTLHEECGPAAASILRDAGRSWGRSLGQRVIRDLAARYAVSVREIPAVRVQASLSSRLAWAGWGRIEFDFARFAEGLIEVTVTNGPSTAWTDSGKPAADQLLAGALAGLLAELMDAELDCLQTDYEVAGAAPARFVIGLPARLAQVADVARRGQPHDRVVAALVSIRV